MSILTIIDVSGIQKYVFGSNRLKEIIGASEIVNLATNDWVEKFLNKSDKEEFTIYKGGGNALLVFPNLERAREFISQYTRKILIDARGLDIVIVHSSEFDRNDSQPTILKCIEEIFDKLKDKKACRQLSAPLLGLAVTAKCVSTNGVATYFDDQRKKYVSRESELKLAASKTANENLAKLLGLENSNIDIPYDFENLGGTKHEASFIGVVHSDGNGMGERVKNAAKGKDNLECIKNMRAFSESIKTANTNALKETADLLIAHIDQTEKTFRDKYGETFDLAINDTNENIFLPFRPLIFGGDDLSFVCDGRIALALTSFYLRALQKYPLTDEKPIFARAGVSIVKSHYPFAKAYEIAEELAANTKKIINYPSPKEVSAIDWHVSMSGMLGSLQEIRNREYTVSEGRLNMRPVFVANSDIANEWRTWKNFENVLLEFQGDINNGEDWRKKRNKVKLLREILRKGENETRNFIETSQKLPKIKHGSEIEEKGWTMSDGINRCGYFDPIEMLDLFFHLDETKNDEQGDETQ